MRAAWRAAIVAATAAMVPAQARGWGAGIAGYSGRNGATCTECHFGGTAPMVTLSGPASLQPGQSGLYTLDVITGASTAKVGFDIAASDGALGVVSGQPNESWLDNGEIAHTKNWPSGKEVQLQFSFTAPFVSGPLTLYVAALRSDGVDDRGGDGTAATTMAVVVEDPGDLAGADLAGVEDLASVDAVSSATRVVAEPKPDAGPPRDEARWACDCRVGGRAGGTPSPGWLLVIALIVWNRWRSRVKEKRGSRHPYA